MLKNLIDSLDNNFNTEVLDELRQNWISSNNIPSHRKKERSLNKEKNFLKNRLQEY